MDKTCTVSMNTQGGYYERGRAFPKSRWVSIIDFYLREIEDFGKCPIWRLKELAKIGEMTARKAVAFYTVGQTIPSRRQPVKGVGVMKGMTMEHHAFIYSLYLDNPSRPNDGYAEELMKEYGIVVSDSFFTRWFKTIGPFKGNYRKTSRFPPAKFSRANGRLFERYTTFMSLFRDPSRFVFADEKPMKEINIYGKVGRDIVTGKVPVHQMNANSNNRWNILAACNIKPHLHQHVQFVVTDETTNAAVFAHFVAHLIETSVLEMGDIFVMDNCSVHMKGDNGALQDQLLEGLGMIMIALPSYWCELNPTELVFQTMLARMKAERARYNSSSNDEFYDSIIDEMYKFSIDDVISFFNKCRYNYFD